MAGTEVLRRPSSRLGGTQQARPPRTPRTPRTRSSACGREAGALSARKVAGAHPSRPPAQPAGCKRPSLASATVPGSESTTTKNEPSSAPVHGHKSFVKEAKAGLGAERTGTPETRNAWLFLEATNEKYGRGDAHESANVDLSGETKRHFQKFVQGYIRASPSPRSEDLRSKFLSDLDSTGRKKRPHKDDHYEVFSGISSEGFNEADAQFRRRCLRMRLKQAQVVMRHPQTQHRESVHESKSDGESDSESSQGETKCAPRAASRQRSRASYESVESTRTFSRTSTSPKIAWHKPDGDGMDKSAAEAAAAGRFALRHQDANLAVMAKMADARTKEACESLRFLVFGVAATEGKRKTERENRLLQVCGTRQEVMQLHKIWNQIDEDGSGDIEFSEFLSFFNKNKGDRLLGMRCVKYLVGTMHEAESTSEQATGCSVEDMMRLMWLGAEPQHIQQMMTWFREGEFQRQRVSTPPLLSKRKRRQVLENFPQLCKSRNSTMKFSDFMLSGIIDDDKAQELLEQFGKSEYDEITEDDILEMLCPNGYRAHANAKMAVDTDGRSLTFISNNTFQGWVETSTATKWNERVGLSDQAQAQIPSSDRATPRMTHAAAVSVNRSRAVANDR
eukprot:gnl/TRDRNA2_/TRDRNA2_83821_c0_seq1.p1 gnl/TRDRNA2_/TRDRNA2_83821_c0~~gnl/TRDRNA2_/TRDRNA2_83821_c0_seq1.p1  ORF type:complete len:620 (+),score=101.24 gnl/TRDRNA2_/TRDRNA2_83821_c0_seq1:253-2112(+)